MAALLQRLSIAGDIVRNMQSQRLLCVSDLFTVCLQPREDDEGSRERHRKLLNSNHTVAPIVTAAG